MATTKIWDVRGRLDHVLTYAKNPDKTEVPFTAGDLQALRDVMDYATNDFKTERQLFVTGINCNPEFARDQMQETKQRWRKEPAAVCAIPSKRESASPGCGLCISNICICWGFCRSIAPANRPAHCGRTSSKWTALRPKPCCSGNIPYAGAMKYTPYTLI